MDTEGGRKRYYDRVMRDSHEGGYGRITVQRALEVSSNTGISAVVHRAYDKDPSGSSMGCALRARPWAAEGIAHPAQPR